MSTLAKVTPLPTAVTTLSSTTPRLKRWPKSQDPKVLKSYLDEELKNKEHNALFIEIFNAKKGEKHLILLRGMPGSGKSILSTLLAGG